MSSSSSPASGVKNAPDNTYTGIADFRRNVLFDENAPEVKEEKGLTRLFKKFQANPMLPLGIATGLGALGFSIHKFRTRDKTQKLSVYLIHTRMAAQGAVVTALTLGVLYSMFKEYVLDKGTTPSLPAPVTPRKPESH